MPARAGAATRQRPAHPRLDDHGDRRAAPGPALGHHRGNAFAKVRARSGSISGWPVTGSSIPCAIIASSPASSVTTGRRSAACTGGPTISRAKVRAHQIDSSWSCVCCTACARRPGSAEDGRCGTPSSSSAAQQPRHRAPASAGWDRPFDQACGARPCTASSRSLTSSGPSSACGRSPTTGSDAWRSRCWRRRSENPRRSPDARVGRIDPQRGAAKAGIARLVAPQMAWRLASPASIASIRSTQRRAAQRHPPSRMR